MNDDFEQRMVDWIGAEVDRSPTEKTRWLKRVWNQLWPGFPHHFEYELHHPDMTKLRNPPVPASSISDDTIDAAKESLDHTIQRFDVLDARADSVLRTLGGGLLIALLGLVFQKELNSWLLLATAVPLVYALLGALWAIACRRTARVPTWYSIERLAEVRFQRDRFLYLLDLMRKGWETLSFEKSSRLARADLCLRNAIFSVVIPIAVRISQLFH